MKTGIAISTYFCDKTPPERLGIFTRSLESLLSTEYAGVVVVVDDGSSSEEHLSRVDSRVRVVRRTHGGVARAKNTCIKELLADNVDIGFLADDDMLYKHSAWHSRYVEAIQKSGIDHFSYFLESTPCELQDIGGVRIRKTPSVNGCFLTFTRKLVDRIGFFKILPNEYGHEHSNFSIRAARLAGQVGFFDIEDSSSCLELIPESIVSKSVGSIDPDQFKENERHAIMMGFQYEPFLE